MFNYRDIGGHPVPDGTVRTGLLYRSNAVVGLDDDAAAALGLRTALDLREAGERAAEPPTVGGAVVHVLPVIDADPTVPYTLHEFTRWLIETRGGAFASAVGLLANSHLPAVFFCSSGKDRTGALAGLILSALGVADDVVAADYGQTETLMPQAYYDIAMARSRRAGMTGDSRIEDLAAPPHLMAAVLDDLRIRYDGAANYLTDHGLKAEDFDRLRTRLVASQRRGRTP